MSYDIKLLEEQIAEKEQHLKELKEIPDVQERSFTDEEISDFDKSVEELADLQKQLATAKRLAIGNDKTEDKKAPQTYRQRSQEPKVTRDDCNDALKAYFAKGKEFNSSKYQKAAEKLNLNVDLDSLTFRLRSNSEAKDYEIRERSQNVGTNADGKFSVNDTVIDSFERAFKTYWSFYDLVDVKRVNGGGARAYLHVNDTSNTGAYVDELDPVTNTKITFARTTMNMFKIGTGVFPISNELIEDSTEDIGSLVGNLVGERLGRFVSSECTNGSTNIEGFTTDSVSAGLTTYYDGIDLEDLQQLYFGVDEHYRNDPSCAWQMHDSTIGALYNAGLVAQYPVFGQGLQAAPMMMLMGKRVVTNNNLPAYSVWEAGTKGIFFGAWSHYKVHIARDMRIETSREKYWAEDAIAVKATMRLDGKLVNAGGDPIKHLVCNTQSGAESVYGTPE